MYRFWDSILSPALDLLRPRSIVEIGIGSGKTTRLLLKFCTDHQATLHAIDPFPQCDVTKIAENPSAFRHYKEPSLSALPRISGIDVVLIDGDHNWYTVHSELDILLKKSKAVGHFPVVFFHDTGWPYGRRDLYYNPALIPNYFRQAYAKGGIVPTQSMLVADGGLNRTLDHALYEGNPKNGVLTAIEDFLQENASSFRFAIIKGEHGLGILVESEILKKNPAFGEFFRSLTVTEPISKHLERLESDRLETMVAMEALREGAESYEKEARTRNVLLLREKENEIRTLQESLAGKEAEVAASEHQCAETEKERALLAKHLAASREEVRMYISELDYRTKTLESELQSRRDEIRHLQHTKSWRWTEPVRLLESKIRQLLHRISRPRQIPDHSSTVPIAKPATTSLPEPVHSTPRPRDTLSDLPSVTLKDSWLAHYVPKIAVIIPCHNYGEYLAAAIDSVLAQTRAPDEIVVVDDASTDDTRTVAVAYQDRGVRYLRGEWKAVGDARNAGLHATRADFLVFLDADDLLHPEYLSCGLEALMEHPAAAIAYTDQQYFGQNKTHYRAPDIFDPKRFDTVNHIHPASIVRRDALVQAGGWSHGEHQDGDWITWRRVLALGWKAVKSKGLWFYRIHDRNMHKTLNADQAYASRAGFLEEPVTLCLSLSGRTWAWPLTRDFLEQQTFAHRNIHLRILDTSQNPNFGREIEQWLAGCDYRSHLYLKEAVGRPGLADLPRAEHARLVGYACAGIYNRFARLITSPLVCFLEDDIIPPLDALPRLIGALGPDTVSVSGACFQRNKNRSPIVWHWTPNGHPVDASPGSGIESVGGNGFGCLVARGDVIQRTVFRTGPDANCFDHNFYRDIVHEKQEYKALVDWNCVCRHYQNATTWSE